MSKSATKVLSKSDLFNQIENFRSFLYFHGYQPPRRLKIRDKVIFDITGESDMEGGYNERVWDRCYHPMTVPVWQEGLQSPDSILSNPLVSAHLFGITRDWIRLKHPLAWENVQHSLKNMTIPFVDPYLHQILPLLPDQAQALMIDIGIRAWEQDMDQPLRDKDGNPLSGFGIWPPELGITMRTAEIMAQKGVSFLVLDQAQIRSDHFAPIYEVKTKNGAIYVLAYNGKEFAQRLAFSQIISSKVFASRVRGYHNNTGMPAFAAMDMETFGEWRGMDSIYFLNSLVHQDLDPENFKRHRSMIKPGEIIDASSWSSNCELGRWSGAHCCAGESPELMELKRKLYLDLREKLDQTLDELNNQSAGWDETFANFFLNTRDSLGGGENIVFSTLSDEYRSRFERLYVNLVGLTSCGWFYTDSDIERNIPKNCIQYLNTAALV